MSDMHVNNGVEGEGKGPCVRIREARATPESTDVCKNSGGGLNGLNFVAVENVGGEVCRPHLPHGLGPPGKLPPHTPPLQKDEEHGQKGERNGCAYSGTNLDLLVLAPSSHRCRRRGRERTPADPPTGKVGASEGCCLGWGCRLG